MLRRLLIAVLVLLLAAVVAFDRVGAHVAAHVLAGKLQTDEHLPQRPSVSIGGIPFLTQAFGGDYHDVDMTEHGFKTADGVTITTLKAHLHGAHIPFSKVVHGSVSKVPVDRVTGTAFMSFTDINGYLSFTGQDLTLSRASAGGIKVVGRGIFNGHKHLVNAVVVASISQSVVTLSGPATSALGSPPLVIPIPIRGLPFRIRISSVTVGGSGVTASGSANHVTLGS